MRIGIVAPHIFMQDTLLSKVIFSPGELAINLANGLADVGESVVLFTPGAVTTRACNITADLSFFKAELTARGDDYLDLLKKHPLTFISLARQVQAELVAMAFQMANDDKLDVVHVYMNEEKIGLSFCRLCQKPVVFTHHDPFSFLAKYRSLFPKYRHLNWLSLSLAQHGDMPADTNWTGNIYHGLDPEQWCAVKRPIADYVLYLGRIIEAKGLHLAIAAVKEYNHHHPDKPLKLKIAGKHYSGPKDNYWREIEPTIDGDGIEYLGFISEQRTKNDLLANAAALIVPSVFAEPFGMVMIEALSSGTPIVGLSSGAIPEIVRSGVTGEVVSKVYRGKVLDDMATSRALAKAINSVLQLERGAARTDFERRFTLSRMVREHQTVYQKLVTAAYKAATE